MDKLGELDHTNRGFEVIRFEDCGGEKCSLQESSSGDRIWLGPSDANPQVMASQAFQYGIDTDVTTGFVPFPIPRDVSLTTRMHLNKEQAAALVKHLQQWINTDTIGL